MEFLIIVDAHNTYLKKLGIHFAPGAKKHNQKEATK